MEASPERVEGGEVLELRREARTALGGRVPVLLAIVLALLSGGLVGYSWRALVVERDAGSGRSCPARSAPRLPPVGQAYQSDGTVRLIFIRDDRPAGPCPGTEAAPAPEPLH
jgi:hypothetical protein